MASIDLAILKDYVDTVADRIDGTNPFATNPYQSIFSALDDFMPASETWVLTTNSDTSFSVRRGTDAITATVEPGYFSVIPTSEEDETKAGGFDYIFYGYEFATNWNYPTSTLDISIPQYQYDNTYSVPIAFTESVWNTTAVYQQFTISRSGMLPVDILLGNGSLNIQNEHTGIRLQYSENSKAGTPSQANIFSPIFQGDAEVFESIETLLDTLGGDILNNLSGFSVDFKDGSFSFIDGTDNYKISDGFLTLTLSKEAYSGYGADLAYRLLTSFLEKDRFLSILDVSRLIKGDGQTIGYSSPVDISEGLEKIEWNGSELFSNNTKGATSGSGFVDQVLIFDGNYETLLLADDERNFVTFGKISSSVPKNFFHLDIAKSNINSNFSSKTSDLFIGGSTQDQMWLAEGNDFAIGHGGDDVFIVWGNGSNQILGGDDTENGDLIVYAFNEDSVLLDLNKGYGERSGGQDTIQEIEHAIGTGASDKLFGDKSDNLFLGASGSDLLKGRGGSDKLFGNDGADTLIGGGGGDYLYADEPYSADGSFATLGTGDRATDMLKGGKGNDTLVAGDGKDKLSGGAGADIFHFLPSFEEKGWEDDLTIVKDFEHGKDKLDFSYFVFSDEAGKTLLNFEQTIRKNFSLVDVDFYSLNTFGEVVTYQHRLKLMGFTEELTAGDII